MSGGKRRKRKEADGWMDGWTDMMVHIRSTEIKNSRHYNGNKIITVVGNNLKPLWQNHSWGAARLGFEKCPVEAAVSHP